MYEALLGIVVLAAIGIPLYIFYQGRKTSKGTPEEEQTDPSGPAPLGALAVGLAHELRSPLSTLSVNLQLLEEELEKGVDEGARRRLRVLQREVQRLEEILSDFLRFAREERLVLKRQDINQVVDEVVDFVEPEAKKNRIEIIRDYTPAMSPASMDVTLIKQALLNMVINAQQAMPEGGKLCVRTRQGEGTLQIEIADTGIGIQKSELDNIFRVYYSTKKKGTGLGLSTAKRIIEGHGGTITVESQEGLGSNFIVRLPLRR